MSRILATHLLSSSASSEFNLNGASFQQDGIASHKGWQYVAYYANDLSKRIPTRNVCLARRRLPGVAESDALEGKTTTADWQTIIFGDYEQTLNDGHNTISMGLSHSDGSIHLSFDNHNTSLIYRRSLFDLITLPDTVPYQDVPGGWSTQSFSPVQEGLDGFDVKDFESATYPRFLTLPVRSDSSASLLLEFRTGMAGLGDTKMYVYGGKPGQAGTYRWESRGVILKGVECNAYINGLTLHPGSTFVPPSIHLTWTYRSYVPVTLEDSRQQAGPNGPENNHDLYHAWSPFEGDQAGLLGGPGKRWYCDRGELIGETAPSVFDGKRRVVGPILPTSPGILAWATPSGNKGITNQESQAVDGAGGVHVLNREEVNDVERWVYYTLPPATDDRLVDRRWQRHLLPHPRYSPSSVFHPRGKMFCTAHQGVHSLYILLPRGADLVLIRRRLQGREEWDGEWEELLSLPGARMMEVSIDEERLRGWERVLSVYVGKYLVQGTGSRTGVVERQEGSSVVDEDTDRWMAVVDVDLEG